MTTAPTLRETYERWTFTYYVTLPPYPGGPCCACADVHEGQKHMRQFWGSVQETQVATLQHLRGYCEEYVKDLKDPGRIERRNTRTIGDRIKSGQAGEKGVR